MAGDRSAPAIPAPRSRPRAEARVPWRPRRVAVRALRLRGGEPALNVTATGGVYLGGGIAPRILPALRAGAFLDRFLGKGRMRPLLESMPVRVVLNDQAALLGAGRCAAVRARA